MTARGDKVIGFIVTTIAVCAVIGAMRWLVLEERETTRDTKLCKMKLQLVKTLADSIRFVESDTGQQCLAYVRSYP